MMKTILCFLLVAGFSCSVKNDSYRKAADALDAGREYIMACLAGDFEKAAFYARQNDASRAYLAELEKVYREKDKEGRQQLRTASLNINEVKDLNDSITQINYSNSFEKIAQTIFIVREHNTWLVDKSKK
ncbi:MAG: hypothetical protein RLZZ28_1499 [Bacteroidota bacterium]|jgi:hypothetical protein